MKSWGQTLQKIRNVKYESGFPTRKDTPQMIWDFVWLFCSDGGSFLLVHMHSPTHTLTHTSLLAHSSATFSSVKLLQEL